MANEIENHDGILCDYGCGQIAKFQFRNGRYCCGSNSAKCPSEIIKISNGRKGIKKPKAKIIENPDGIICDYGCGQIAKYHFANDKYCCSDHVNKCAGKINVFDSIENPDGIICDYGCGQIAKFQTRSGKYCCSDHSNKCIYKIKELIEIKTGMIYTKPEYFENSDNKLCDFGCGQIAHYKLNNGRYCCNEHFNQCPFISNIVIEKNKMTFKKLIEFYPELIVIENLKEGPNGEVLGHCKNSKCDKSIDHGNYFELTAHQIQFRYYALDTISDGYYFYCCEECKKECVLYNKSARQLEILLDPDTNPNQATSQELSIWRKEVFTRQLKDNPTHSENFCERCHSTENLVGHHIQPQKLYPEFALDPINGMILCSECHNKYGHEKGTECSTGNLANKPCK
jgi:hypothetical protein